VTELLDRLKQFAKARLYPPDAVRRCWIGPYRGLVFEVSHQVRDTRMSIFYRAYEPEVTKALADLVRPEMVVYDIGAHVGIHALYLARLLGPPGQVVAFEPWSENYCRLVRNIGLNGALEGRITAVPLAVGDHPGGQQMVQGTSDGRHSLAAHGEAGDRSVTAVRVDDFAREHPPGPDLLLIDVEGREDRVLAGAIETIAQRRPQIILEHHGPARARALTSWLRDHGYQVAPIGVRHLRAY
jgi:FkbM family methyltransferase